MQADLDFVEKERLTTSFGRGSGRSVYCESGARGSA
jgi:hypothetical protein